MSNQLFENREELLASIADGTTPSHAGIRLLDSLKTTTPVTLKTNISSEEKAVDSTKNIPWFQLRILS